MELSPSGDIAWPVLTIEVSAFVSRLNRQKSPGVLSDVAYTVANRPLTVC